MLRPVRRHRLVRAGGVGGEPRPLQSWRAHDGPDPHNESWSRPGMLQQARMGGYLSSSTRKLLAVTLPKAAAALPKAAAALPKAAAALALVAAAALPKAAAALPKPAAARVLAAAAEPLPPRLVPPVATGRSR